MNGELLRIVDAIHRDKDIDKEVLLEGIESALLTAAKKRLGNKSNLSIHIDRKTGELMVLEDNETVVPIDLGRIAAQTAKQVIIQKIREAERDSIFEEYEKRAKAMTSGTVQRFESGNLIINLGKTEGYLPKHEQVRGENYHVGDRIRAYVVDVKKVGQKVKISLSRTHPDLVRRLFELEVPEIADRVIEVKGLAREPGYRTKIAVESTDPKIDCVGACVGVRGTRIKNIADELNGEKIDIIRWSDDPDQLIVNALKPAVINSIVLDEETFAALVIVDEEQLSLAIGKKGQNVRLAAKLCNWEINIITQQEYDTGELEKAKKRGIRGSVAQELEEIMIAEGKLPTEEEEEGGETTGEGSASEEAPAETAEALETETSETGATEAESSETGPTETESSETEPTETESSASPDSEASPAAPSEAPTSELEPSAEGKETTEPSKEEAPAVSSEAGSSAPEAGDSKVEDPTPTPEVKNPEPGPSATKTSGEQQESI